MTTRLAMHWQIHREFRSDGWTYSVAPRDTAITGVKVSMHPQCHSASPSLVGAPPDSAMLNLTQVNVGCRNWVNRNTTVNGIVYASYDSLVDYTNDHEKCHGTLAIRKFSGTGGVTALADQKSLADTTVRDSESLLLQDVRLRLTGASDTLRDFSSQIDTTVVLRNFMLFNQDSTKKWQTTTPGTMGKLC